VLAGDLDNLLAKALAKDPARRYASAAALAEDIGRYLRHEPITARPDRWTYRAQKFVRRHRTAVAAAVIAVAMLTAAAVITTTQMLEARRQRDEAEFQARRAQASSEFIDRAVCPRPSSPTMRACWCRSGAETRH
jgi:serine/threonine-protein kinase